jgi:hypothetical protein
MLLNAFFALVLALYVFIAVQYGLTVYKCIKNRKSGHICKLCLGISITFMSMLVYSLAHYHFFYLLPTGVAAILMIGPCWNVRNLIIYLTLATGLFLYINT